MRNLWKKAGWRILMACAVLFGSQHVGALAFVNDASLYVGGGAGDNGPATDAYLNNPAAVAVDDNGDLYIADFGNHVVRKVDGTTGEMATFAGTLFEAGYAGDGGHAAAATLNSPADVAIRDGYLYIADYGNHVIRRVHLTTAVIETFAGDGVMAESDGGIFTDEAVKDGETATSGRLNGPVSIAFDPAGNLLIVEETHRVRIVDAELGTIDTYAGTGESYFVSANGDGGDARSAKLNIQRGNGIAVDESGHVYVGDATNAVGFSNGGTIRKIDAETKIITTVAGSGLVYNADGVSALTAKMTPAGMDVRGTDLYVYDRDFAFVRRIDLTSGNIHIIAGTGTAGFSGDGGPATAARTHGSFGSSFGGVSAAADDNLFVADAKNHRIRNIDSGGTIATVAGGGIGLSGNAEDLYLHGTFDNTQMVMDDQNNLYFTDGYQFVYKVDAATGKVEKIAGVLDYWTQSYVGGYSGDGGAAVDAELNNPTAIALDGDGNLYVYDQGNSRIRKIAKDTGVITTIAGNGQTYSAPADYVAEAEDATTVKLGYTPGSSLVVDGDGNLYFAEGGASVSLVRKLTPNGDGTYAISTYAGGPEVLSPGAASDQWGDGMPATSGRISGFIQRLAIDSGENLYITSNNAPYLLRKVDPDGILHTVAGNTALGTINDGDAANAKGTNLNVIAVNSKDEVFLTTQGSSPATIWRVTEGRYLKYYTNQVGWNKTMAFDNTDRLYIGTSLYSTNNPYGIVRLDAPEATTITLSSSDPVQAVGSSVTFTAEVSDPGDEGWVAFKNGDTLLGVNRISEGQASYSTNALAEGSHTITARYIGTHRYGDSVSDGLTQVVAEPDETAPAVTAASIRSSNAKDDMAKSGDTVTLSFETDEDVQTPTVMLAGRQVTASPANEPSASEWTAETVMLSGDPEGVVAFSILVEDLAGNAAQSVTATTDDSSVVYDNTPPTGTVSYSTTDVTNGNVTATIAVADDGTAVINNEGELAYHFESNGSFTFELEDEAGNTAQVTATVANIDKTAPTATAVTMGASNADAAKAKVGDTITLNVVTSEDVQQPTVTIAGNAATAVQGANEHTWAATYTMQEVDSEGDVAFTLDFEDLAGNAAAQVTATTDDSGVTFDKTPPAKPTVAIAPELPTNQNVVVTISFSGDSVSKWYKLGDGEWLAYSDPIEIEANTSVYAKSLDATGNESEAASRAIENMNKVKPVITVTGEMESQHEVKTTYADAGATAQDDQDGDLTGQITVTGAVYSDEPGTYVLRYNVIDSAGNEAQEKTRTVHVADTTLPVVTLIGDAAMLTPIGSSFTDPGATATDNYDGDLTNLISVTGEVDTAALGVYTLTYRVEDSSGNEGTAERTVTVFDQEHPVIVLRGDANMTHEAGTPFQDPGADATDGQDGDVTDAITVTGAVYHDQLGTYTLKYDVQDEAGNPATSVTRTVEVVDTTKPVITLLGDHALVIPQHGDYTDPGATATDNYDGDLTNLISVTGTVQPDQPGTYVVTYDVSDVSGNAADTVERTVEVLSNDASLQQLTVSRGTLTPAFAPETLEYSVTVAYSIDRLTATVRVNESHAQVKINDQAQALDDTDSSQTELVLNVGRNETAIEVTAHDGTIRTYALVVQRENENNVNSNPPSTPPASSAPDNPGVDVLVNGKAESAGTATTEEVNGQRILTIAVDEEKLQQRLQAEGERAVIAIPVTAGHDIVVGELNGRMVKTMELQQAVVEIRTDKAKYTLPAQQINIDAVSELFGANLALQDIKVKIEIAEPAADTVRVVEDAANREGFTLVVPPLNFKVSAVYGDRTEEVSKFNAYVKRTVAIPEGVDPNRITTGVVVEPDGTVRHVPTKIVLIDGFYYAEINSLTNSTYSVVWHQLEFKDAANHWAKGAVNDMGSRMVMEGTGDDMFSPDRDITRAEFTDIVVRGLGLPQENNMSIFTDVKPTDRYSGAVQTAYEYGLINGWEDGTFRANENITREQAMLIVSKAMAIAELPGMGDGQDANEVLRAFADAGSVSNWALNGVADSVSAGIISGRSGERLEPRAFMTRAEAAVIMQRLLQKSDLINE